MPDNLIREISLIKRYSIQNDAEDMRFRTFIKTKLDLSNAELDAQVRETTDEVWRQIDCTKCANCCKTLHVELDDKDIKVLSKRLEISPRVFAERYLTTASDGEKVFTSTPCPMLGDDNRCTVYEDRPKACRDFPFLHEKDFRARTLMMISNTACCPIVFNVWQRLKYTLGFRKRR